MELIFVEVYVVWFRRGLIIGQPGKVLEMCFFSGRGRGRKLVLVIIKVKHKTMTSYVQYNIQYK